MSTSVAGLCVLALAGSAHGTESRWTIPDIVQVREIQSVAMSSSGDEAAYVLREPSLAADAVAYELYDVAIKGKTTPKLVLRADYISGVTASPRRGYWTILADVGDGVQLYDVSDHGVPIAIAASKSMAIVGGHGGTIAPLGEPHRTGVISYQWSPDGKRLWYTTFRLRTPAQRKAFIESGVEYDDRRLAGGLFRNFPGLLLGYDLHVKNADGSRDRVMAFVPSVQATDITAMSRMWATAMWEADSRHVDYGRYVIANSGRLVKVSWSVDTDTGFTRQLRAAVDWQSAVPAADGRGYYAVKGMKGGGRHLWELSFDGAKPKDLGSVPFLSIGLSSFIGGTWINKGTGEQILSAYYPDRTGLATVPQSPAGRIWERITDNLHPCDFSNDLRVGVCVRQSQILAPELVAVSGMTGHVRVIARPNADYDRIAPLRIERALWTNRYGQVSDGYIVYPRQFSPSRKYPVVVVTHGDDARNTFADRDLQAEIPVQALAESGYVVALVNEPLQSLRTHGAQILDRAGAHLENVTRTELSVIVQPVASMEAAVASLVRKGMADPSRVGIAGYSRGAEVVMYAMTQSKVFKVASVDDGASGVNADGYWSFGNRISASMYHSLYGGGAFSSDAKVLEAYRRFSPDFRTAEFAGPLLEQPDEGTASWAFERLALLRDAGIPYDLVFYPNEAHIFWNPHATAASMQRTLDWFNYWLLGRRDPDPAKVDEYRRWNAMYDTYREHCPSCLVQ